MPSEQQLQKALQEQKDLERELELLNKGQDAKLSAESIMQYIEKNEEGLIDEENNPWISGGKNCTIL